jgi:hypothetical protein
VSFRIAGFSESGTAVRVVAAVLLAGRRLFVVRCRLVTVGSALVGIRLNRVAVGFRLIGVSQRLFLIGLWLYIIAVRLCRIVIGSWFLIRLSGVRIRKRKLLVGSRTLAVMSGIARVSR